MSQGRLLATLAIAARMIAGPVHGKKATPSSKSIASKFPVLFSGGINGIELSNSVHLNSYFAAIVLSLIQIFSGRCMHTASVSPIRYCSVRWIVSSADCLVSLIVLLISFKPQSRKSYGYFVSPPSLYDSKFLVITLPSALLA